MSGDDRAVPQDRHHPNQPLSREQLEAFERGWAATIMPATGGWKVHYFSIQDFDAEPGTLFASFEDAMNAVAAVLPAVNSAEERERALRELDHSPE